MWKNDRRAALIRNIIYAVLAAVVLLYLAVAYKHISAKNAAIDKALTEAHTQQQEQLVAEKQESLDALQAEYENDLATVARYMPGIVCWGDLTTAGTTGSVSYPSTLQKYIETYITGVYTFSDSIADAATYTGVDWDSYDVSIPVVNMGVGQQNTQTIMGRCGATSFKLAGSVNIPADCTPVTIYFISQNGTAVNPLNGGDVGVNAVTLGGIEGTLSVNTAGVYSFTRSVAGEETWLDAGTELTMAGANLYKDYIHVICVGNYDNSPTADTLVNEVKTILARQTQNTDRYIVLGIWCSNGEWLTDNYYDTAMIQAFGDHYINAHKYLVTDALTDAGISATSSDKEATNKGAVPTSFRSAASDGELTAKAYKLLGKLIYNRMDELGYFDEIKSELAIDTTTKKLLASNAKYFTNILSAQGY